MNNSKEHYDAGFEVRPRYICCHPNPQGTGTSVKFDLHPAHGYVEGSVFATFASQKTTASYVDGKPVPPTFDWENSVTIRLTINEVAEMLEVFRGYREKLLGSFEGAVATPEETEAEMRRMREVSGYVLDPHTAVATAVARKLGYPKAGRPLIVAATATPYKFPETCMKAFGADILDNPPPSFAELDSLPQVQTKVVDLDGIDGAVKELF